MFPREVKRCVTVGTLVVISMLNTVVRLIEANLYIGETRCKGDGGEVDCMESMSTKLIAITTESKWAFCNPPAGVDRATSCTCLGNRTVCVSAESIWEYDSMDGEILEDRIKLTGLKQDRNRNLQFFDDHSWFETALIFRIKGHNHFQSANILTWPLDFWGDELNRAYLNCGGYFAAHTLHCNSPFNNVITGINQYATNHYSGTLPRHKWATRGHIVDHGATGPAQEITDLRIVLDTFTSADLFLYNTWSSLIDGSLKVYPATGSCTVTGADLPVGGVSWSCSPPPSSCVETLHGYACSFGGTPAAKFDTRYYTVSDEL